VDELGIDLYLWSELHRCQNQCVFRLRQMKLSFFFTSDVHMMCSLSHLSAYNTSTAIGNHDSTHVHNDDLVSSAVSPYFQHVFSPSLRLYHYQNNRESAPRPSRNPHVPSSRSTTLVLLSTSTPTSVSSMRSPSPPPSVCVTRLLVSPPIL